MNYTTEYDKRTSDQRLDSLVVEHLEYVRHILGRLTYNLPANIDIENLESAGILGLVEAAKHFDESRGVPFKGFAYSRIRGAILDELRRNCPLSQQMLRQIAVVRTAAESITPPVTSELIAEKTGLSVDNVESCLAAMRLTRTQTWDDTVCGVRARRGSDDPQQAVFDNELKHLLADCIELLPRQERIAVTLYYMEDLRLKEIGEVLGLSESRVSRILNGAEERLRTLINSKTS